MSKQVSKALLEVVNEMSDVESTISKIDGVIFVRENEQMIKEKISYLYNLLHAEAKFYNQKQDTLFDITEQLVDNYKQKLNLVYDEFYCQYVNIQNEIQDARLNQKIAIINYQKIINDKENGINRNYNEIEKKLNNKYELYSQIIDKCNKKFKECKLNFDKKMNEAFLIESSLIVANNNFFSKLKNKVFNFFKGAEKYKSVVDNYNQKVNDIDTKSIINEMRNETIQFITDILKIRRNDEDELEDAI